MKVGTRWVRSASSGLGQFVNCLPTPTTLESTVRKSAVYSPFHSRNNNDYVYKTIAKTRYASCGTRYLSHCRTIRYALAGKCGSKAIRRKDVFQL